jgi:hypothetical protein
MYQGSESQKRKETSMVDDNYEGEISLAFLSKAVAQNRESLGLPPQSATFCCFKDPLSPRVCDRYRDHDGFHNDSTMPTGATERTGINKAIEAKRLEKEAATQS